MNQDKSHNNALEILNFGRPINNVHIERTVSRVLYSGFSSYFT